MIFPLTVAIPIDQIVLIPRDRTHEGRVRIYLSVLDRQGKTSPVQEIAVPMSIPSNELETALTKNWKQEVLLRVRPGDAQIAVGVWDEIGRTSSLLRERFQTSARP